MKVLKYKGIPLFILLPIVSILAFCLIVFGFLTFSTYQKRALPVMEGQFFENDSIIITQDFGGRVADKISHLFWLNHRDYKVRIEGICASSCTLYLGAQDVCVSRDATLMIHPAHLEPDIPYLSPMVLSMNNIVWRMMLPTSLAKWIEDSTKTMEPQEVYWFLGQDLIDQGWVAQCTPDSQGNLDKKRDILSKIPFQTIPKNPLPRKEE